MATQNRIASSATVRGESAYVYAFKARAKNHHCLGHGTMSVDFAQIEALRRQYSKEKKPITYLPIFVKATALAVQKTPEANAILFKKLFGYRIVQFEQVDVNLPITRKVDGRLITFIGTIRNAPHKTLSEIQDELTHLQRCPPEESFAIQRIQKFSKMPLWLSKLIHWRMTTSPQFYIDNVGTCGLTLIEGDWFDQFFPIAPTSIVMCPGGVKSEPVVRNNQIVVGRVLKVSMMGDNYVISGLIGAKVAKEWKDLIETGSFIRAELEQNGATAAANPTAVAAKV